MRENQPIIRNSLELLKEQYRKLSIEMKIEVADAYYQLRTDLQLQNYHSAIISYAKYKKISQAAVHELEVFLYNQLGSEDVIEPSSAIVIHSDSPFRTSLCGLAQKLKFHVVTHELQEGPWTKDYVISTGDQVMVPAHENTKRGLSPDYDPQRNPMLYYGGLGVEEHHSARAKILASKSDWNLRSRHIIFSSASIDQVIIEGGNFFCARNRYGQKYYLVGENVISETCLRMHISRKVCIERLAEHLKCIPEDILSIPQWTYHLDLQMAYLGHGQFVIHSFNQSNFEFDLADDVKTHCQNTFQKLHNIFEKKIIDRACKILTSHAFDVKKIFGCLFYLTDIEDQEQLNYVPYCKNSEDGSGAVASLINGIAGKSQHDHSFFFITTRCENSKFKAQFEASLKEVGSIVYYADMLECYDPGDKSFDGMLAGVLGLHSVSQYIAYMDGALRCQTSIIPKSALSQISPDFECARLSAVADGERVSRSCGNSPVQDEWPDPEQLLIGTNNVSKLLGGNEQVTTPRNVSFSQSQGLFPAAKKPTPKKAIPPVQDCKL